MPNALLLLVNALLPNALILLDELRKNAADRNFIAMPCSQNAFPVLLAQQAVHNFARARLIHKVGQKKKYLRFG